VAAVRALTAFQADEVFLSKASPIEDSFRGRSRRLKS